MLILEILVLLKINFINDCINKGLKMKRELQLKSKIPQIIDLPDGWTCIECGDEYLNDIDGKLVDDYNEGTICKKCNSQH